MTGLVGLPLRAIGCFVLAAAYVSRPIPLAVPRCYILPGSQTVRMCHAVPLCLAFVCAEYGSLDVNTNMILMLVSG